MPQGLFTECMTVYCRYLPAQRSSGRLASHQALWENSVWKWSVHRLKLEQDSEAYILLKNECAPCSPGTGSRQIHCGCIRITQAAELSETTNFLWQQTVKTEKFCILKWSTIEVEYHGYYYTQWLKDCIRPTTSSGTGSIRLVVMLCLLL